MTSIYPIHMVRYVQRYFGLFSMKTSSFINHSVGQATIPVTALIERVDHHRNEGRGTYAFVQGYTLSAITCISTKIERCV